MREAFARRGNGHGFVVTTFQKTLSPDLELLAPFRHLLSSWLRQVGVAEPPRSALVLATHEAVANAIEHARTSAPIEVRARISAATVAVEVKDHGSWRERPSVNEERGRGLELIEGLVSAVKIETEESGTTLRLLQQI